MTDVGGIAAERLRSFIERVERLEEEKKALNADVRDVFAEAKGAGFDVKIMKKVIKMRSVDRSTLSEEQQLLELYCRAVDLQLEFSLDTEA